MPTENDTLPVAMFEKFMLAGDSHDFPMSFVFEFEFAGRLDVDRLHESIQRCVTRHPLLFATVDVKQKRWHLSQDWTQSIEQGDYGRALRFDLTSEPGFRVFVNEADATAQKIGFVFHHACVDGLGAFHFVSDVANVYGEDFTTTADPSPNIAYNYLKRFRNSYGDNRLLHFLRWPFDLLGMLWSLEMVLNRPKPIEPELQVSACPQHPSDGKSLPTSNVDRILTIEETLLARELSKSAGQTLNDRVLQSVFLAIEEWNSQYNPGNQGSLIRLMVPMNLRRKPSESAANMVAMVNFDRKVGRWRSAYWFRQLLRMEMLAVKRTRAGVIANRYLQVQNRILGRWPMQENHGRCLTTCLVSNLGDLSRVFAGKPAASIKFGELPVTNFRVITPLRPHSNVFICLFSYQGRLNFNVTFNTNVLKKAHVEFLMDSVERHLLQNVQSIQARLVWSK